MKAIKVLLERGLIEATRASDVVPEIIGLLGCSGRTAQAHTRAYRADMVAKRDRLIVQMYDAGRTQQQIADELEVPRQTITVIIQRLAEKRRTAEISKTKKAKHSAKPPGVPVELPDEEDDEPEETLRAACQRSR